MKIAHIVESFSSLSETFIYSFVVGLQQRGHDSRVFAGSRVLPDQRPYSAVELWQAPARWTPRRALSALAVRLNLRAAEEHARALTRPDLANRLVAFRPDIIHAQFGPMGVMVAPVARRLGIPLVVSFHGYDVARLSRLPAWQRAYQQLVRQATAITGTSNYLCARLVEIGFPPERITQIYMGSDLANLHYRDPAYNFTGPMVQCLHVGRLVPKKAPLHLVKAFALARATLLPALDLRLTIAGDGPLHDAVRQEIHALHLQEAVRLLGQVDHADVRRLMREAHIYTQHCVTGPDGDTEGQGVSFVEASASGLPIVTTRHNGIPDVVLDGTTGYLVEEGDIEGMAARIVELARTPARWTEFGRAGRQHIEDHFTLDQQLDKTLALYQSILEHTPNHPMPLTGGYAQYEPKH